MVGCLLLVFGNVKADPSLDQTRSALKIIADFAEDLCSTVKDEGHRNEWSVSADGKAQLSGVVKKIADLGFGGAAAISREEHAGVLQRDLTKVLTEKVLSEKGSCKKGVYDDLKSRLLAPSASVKAASQPTFQTSPAMTVSGNRNVVVGNMSGGQINNGGTSLSGPAGGASGAVKQ